MLKTGIRFYHSIPATCTGAETTSSSSIMLETPVKRAANVPKTPCKKCFVFYNKNYFKNRTSFASLTFCAAAAFFLKSWSNSFNANRKDSQCFTVFYSVLENHYFTPTSKSSLRSQQRVGEGARLIHSQRISRSVPHFRQHLHETKSQQFLFANWRFSSKKESRK